MADYNFFRSEKETADHEKWGFENHYHDSHYITCPACRALIYLGPQDDKLDTDWWKHIQWHVKIGEFWDWQP